MAKRYWAETGLKKGFGGYAVRERDLRPPFGKLRDEVFEILQLKQQGRVIRGELNLSDVPEPSREDMRRSLIASIPDLLGGWRRSYPPPIDARDARVNNILYWLRILIWDRTGGVCARQAESSGCNTNSQFGRRDSHKSNAGRRIYQSQGRCTAKRGGRHLP